MQDAEIAILLETSQRLIQTLGQRASRPLTVLLLVLSFVLTAHSAEKWTFKGGTCEADGAGGYVLDVGARRLRLEACWVTPGWGQPVIRDALRVSVTNDALHVAVSAVQGRGQKLHEKLPMFVRLSGDASFGPTERLMLGNRVQTFEKGSWGWGDCIQLAPCAAEVRLASAVSMNFLREKNGDWLIRMYIRSKKEPDGRLRFEGTLDLAQAAFKLTMPGDMLIQKRTQYGRVLMPPQEKGFDATLWLRTISATNATQEDFARVEALLDARSRLYAAAERLSYKPTMVGSAFHRRPQGDDDSVAQLVTAGYAALNRMDLAGATNACAQLESCLPGSEAWMPYGTFNPFNWVKCFTQWGYMRAPDGCSVSEPNPWLLQWEDGFRFNLAQDERVVTAHGKGNDRFYETRYLKPMTGVSFERSWVSTAWNLPDRRITFSVLTPVVDVEGVDVLTLSGFSSEPRRMDWVNDRGQISSIQLVSCEEPPAEVVPSVLMDFKAPPPPPKTFTRGEQKIDASRMLGPYFRVGGRDWTLAFFPTARPVSVAWRKGVLTLRFDRKGSVGVLRLRDNLHGPEQAEVCEFFARTALAYPTACRSGVENGVARWTYDYRLRANAWGTEPRVLAPVPPLLDYANVAVPGSRAFKYPQKWGLYRYCEGREVRVALPSDLPREPRLCGVNVCVFDEDAVWEAHVTNGAHWVRAYLGGKAPLAEQCAALEGKLKAYGSRIRFLIDPHGREYQVSWGSGMDPDPAVEGRFLALWDALSKIGAKYPHAVEGYDLYNEPGCVAGSEARWRALNERAAALIHRNHPTAKVYYSAVYGGNPNGLFNLAPLGPACGPQAVTYHFYSPHAFSHQKCATHNRGGDTCVFYPAWSAPIDWAAGHHFGGTTVDWYDRWTLAAILLPAFEHYAAHRMPQHVGEFGVIGYANGRSPRSAFLWTRDVVELVESNGASWHIWNGGFGLGNAFVRDYVYGLWRHR